ncbi:MAG TPA: 2-oxoglutarate dehydrogenase E1 component [Polyangia bacterium]|jgi:2-oxoglutarate dehydrogenase E1 component|nr:2-oxoglutarate dehydrogenase E1 component [Polyangia bacterium]
MIEVKANGTATTHAEPALSSAINPSNLAFVEELYGQFLQDPSSIEPAFRAYFESLDNGVPRPSAGAIKPPADFSRSIFATVNGTSNGHGLAALAMPAKPPGRLQSERAQRLVEAYRELGHLSADLDPLGMIKRSGAPLDLEFYGLSSAELDQVFSSETVAGPDRTTLRDLVQLLRETYCRHIGVELAHLHDIELRTWLQNRMESTRNRLDLTVEERYRLLEKVTDAEVFEQFLHKKFLGAKRFSLEGAESLIPLLDRLIERAARSQVREIVIGMAHRGRLNVLANVLEKPAAQIFAEFMDKHGEDSGSGGDVKYHLGHSTDRVFGGGADALRVHLSLSFNPSHLEWVNTVVQGRVRAKQDRLNDTERSRCLPLLIHGDAAFAGQGIVAEAFNLSELDGYRVGGTVHIVVNNQIGFTTSPRSGYSTTYATDVARMLQIPIFHVNGEDPEAVSQVVDLALDFRQRFHRDVLIEMWCYRKYGHNEGDEPAFTQPIMYRAIAAKPSIRMAFVQAFADRPPSDDSKPITVADADAMATKKREALDRELEKADKLEVAPRGSTFAGAWSQVRGGADNTVPQVPTAVPASTIQAVGRVLTQVPPGFSMHPKLKDIVDGRAEMALGQKPINWGMGEALAFGTLLNEGVRVRFTGQDVRRGTFSHRHSVFVDYQNGREYSPLAEIHGSGAKPGTFEIRDSPLSEAGVLGFDYGYSLDMPDGLTLWEAQFGDFVNGAQVIIDQFLVSSEVKWNRVSGLVLLLPHGMEGQGPEHSSARLERFLTMAVNDNIQVCDLTTPAQYFHVLRRQVLRPYRKPLIIMTPKSLLRHPVATSQLAEFTNGGFQHIIPDVTVKNYSKVRRVLLCTGKVYYDLIAEREERKYNDVAILRVEQLYPLQIGELLEMLSVYPEGTPLVWVQEEPRNMGAWVYMNRELPAFLSGSFTWSCASRPLSSSPAVGSLGRHKREQARLMADAFGTGAL